MFAGEGGGRWARTEATRSVMERVCCMRVIVVGIRGEVVVSLGGLCCWC